MIACRGEEEVSLWQEKKDRKGEEPGSLLGTSIVNSETIEPLNDELEHLTWTPAA